MYWGLWVLMVVLFLLTCSVSSSSHMKLCYLYFGSITDLGYTFTYNVGRLKVHEALQAEFSGNGYSMTFESTATADVFFATSEERHAIIQGYIQSNCNVILSNNAALMNGEDDYFAVTYPNVSFILLDEYRLEDRTYPNRVYVANDFTGSYYVAGAAAGTQAKRCIAFLAAWNSEVDPTNAFAGFLLGVRRVNPTITVHVVPQQSYYYPESDTILTKVFLQSKRCDVIARYSDPNVVDVAVYEYASSSMQDKIFSIGPHSNLEQYVGDSVLTAAYIDWSVALLAVLRPLIINGTWDHQYVHFYGMNHSALLVAPPSPRADPSVAAAMAAATAAVHQADRDMIVCGALPLSKGGTMFPPSSSPTQCKLPWTNLADFIVDQYVTVHPRYQSQQTCTPGTVVQYVFSPALTLHCLPCPVDTYSSVIAAAECTPCPSGSSTSGGTAATVCVATPAVSVGTAVGISVAGFALALILSWIFVTIRAARQRHADAPREPPLCMIIVEVEGIAAIRQLRPEEVNKSLKLMSDLVSSIAARNEVYEVRQRTRQSEERERFVLASKTAFDAVATSLEIQESLYLASWPPAIRELGGLKPRIAIHLCEDVEVFFHMSEGHYDYRGADVDLTESLAEVASSGCILITQDVMESLQQDEDFAMVLAYEVTIRVWRDLDPLEPRETLAGKVLFALHSKQLQRLQEAEHGHSRMGQTALPQLPGADPELERSAHSSFETASSVSFGRVAGTLNAPQVAMALFNVLSAADEENPKLKRELVALLSNIFHYNKRHQSSRRVAAFVASRVFTAASGVSTAGATDASPGPANPLSGMRVPAGGQDSESATSSGGTGGDAVVPAVVSSRRTGHHHVTEIPQPPPPRQRNSREDSGVLMVPATQHEPQERIVYPWTDISGREGSRTLQESVSLVAPSVEVEMLPSPSSPGHS